MMIPLGVAHRAGDRRALVRRAVPAARLDLHHRVLHRREPRPLHRQRLAFRARGPLFYLPVLLRPIRCPGRCACRQSSAPGARDRRDSRAGRRIAAHPHAAAPLDRGHRRLLLAVADEAGSLHLSDRGGGCGAGRRLGRAWRWSGRAGARTRGSTATLDRARRRHGRRSAARCCICSAAIADRLSRSTARRRRRWMAIAGGVSSSAICRGGADMRAAVCAVADRARSRSTGFWSLRVLPSFEQYKPVVPLSRIIEQRAGPAMSSRTPRWRCRAWCSTCGATSTSGSTASTFVAADPIRSPRVRGAARRSLRGV